jgi:hypothetical protein
MRGAVAAVVDACGPGAAPAGAATVGVYDGPELSAVALAGPDAVVLRQARWAQPADGGSARRWHAADGADRGAHERRLGGESRRLAASAARVAMIAEIDDAHADTVEWRVCSGPPHGPLGVGSDGDAELDVDVPGARTGARSSALAIGSGLGVG